jgi:cytochrome b6-f complex iron-sulfur subunit
MAPRSSSRRQAQRTLVVGAVALAACLVFSLTFVAPLRAPSRAQSAVTMFSGEYTGFVPDMQRRTLMNLVTVAATAVPVAVLVGGYAFYFFPQISGGAGGAVLAGDKDGNPVKLDAWVKNHKPNDRELVQGLKGEATYIVSTADGIKDFGINAVCTHLGCVVPWNLQANRFICPCHGSQYDENGKVVRGPAPLSLALCHAVVQDGNIAVSPWTEEDFRTGLQPWWS